MIRVSKRFAEETLGTCQEIIKTWGAESRPPTDEEASKVDKLVALYCSAAGVNRPPGGIRNAVEQLANAPSGLQLNYADVLTQDDLGPLPNLPINGQNHVYFDTGDGGRVRAFRHGESLSESQPSFVGREDRPSFGAVIHNMITGSDRHLDGDMAAAIVPGSSSSKGTLATPWLGRQIYDLARSKTVVSRAGGLTIDMETPELTLASVSEDPVSHWRHETVAVPASDIKFSAKVLRPRTLACIIPLSIELVEDASNVTTVLENVVSSAIALKIDQAALLGVEAGGEMGGVLNEDGVHEVSSVGTPTDYSEISTGIGNIMGANYPGDDASGLAWIANPRDLLTFDGLTDSTGQPLMPTPWAGQLQRLQTTSLEVDGSSETQMVLGDFSQLVLGVRTSGLRFELLREGSVTDLDSKTWNATSQLLVHLRAYIRVASAVIKPQYFSKLTGVTNT